MTPVLYALGLLFCRSSVMLGFDLSGLLAFEKWIDLSRSVRTSVEDCT